MRGVWGVNEGCMRGACAALPLAGLHQPRVRAVCQVVRGHALHAARRAWRMLLATSSNAL